MADKPHFFVEPPVPTTTEFLAVEQVRAVIHQLDVGNFRMPALLLERMLWNPRLRAVVETRLAGFTATQIRFKPARNNRDARRAAKELKQDWPLMMPSPMRKQFLQAAIFLGIGLGQRVLDTSRISGRAIYKLRPYWPGFASWYWAKKAYRIQTFDRGVTEAETPSIDAKLIDRFMISPLLDPVPPANETPWVISEPYGTNSWRGGLIHAAWRPWLGHDWAMRDQARASEKHGIGVTKAYYPRGEGDEHKAAVKEFARDLRTGAEGMVPLERRFNVETGENEGFDIEPFEFNGSGFQAISDTMNSNAVALAILLPGHNLTTEIKGGGSYAAAGVADYIRDDKKHEDAETEKTYAEPQLIAQWAMANYQDPGLAPVIEHVTDSPAVNLARSQMIYYLAQAAAQLRANVPTVDLEALAEEFDLPMLDAKGKALVQVPAAVPPATPAPANDDGARAMLAAQVELLAARVAELEARAA